MSDELEGLLRDLHEARKASILQISEAELPETVCACGHPFAEPPPIFPTDYTGLSVQEIREKYPRVTSTCASCGTTTVRYASYLHYIAGDW